MKILMITRLTTCRVCIGRGYIELANGSTKECITCKGKGIF